MDMTYRDEFNSIIEFSVRWAREVGNLSDQALMRFRSLRPQFRRTSSTMLGQGMEARAYPAFHPQHGYAVSKVHKDGQTVSDITKQSTFGTTRMFKDRWSKAQAEGVQGLQMPLGYHKKGIHQARMMEVGKAPSGKVTSDIVFKRDKSPEAILDWTPSHPNIGDTGTISPAYASRSSNRHHNMMYDPASRKVKISDFLYKPDVAEYRSRMMTRRSDLMEDKDRIERAKQRATSWTGRRSKKKIVEGLEHIQAAM